MDQSKSFVVFVACCQESLTHACVSSGSSAHKPWSKLLPGGSRQLLMTSLTEV